MAAGRQNYKLDLFKCIAAYCVVLIHVPLPGMVGNAANCLARFAVPLFFLVSGYYSRGRSSRSLVRKALRTAGLLLAVSGVLLALGCVLALRAGNSLGGYLKGLLSPPPHVLRELLLFQVVPLPYAWPLWFLGALALVYILWAGLTWCCERRNSPLPCRALGLGAVLLLAVHLALGEGRGLAGLEPVRNLWLRNAWLDGLPFFALGVWMGENRRTIEGFPRPALLVGVAAGALLALAERAAAGVVDLYLGSALMAVLLLALSVADPEVKSAALRQTACFCGRHLTFFIFAFHVPIYGVMKEWQGEVPAFAWALGQSWLLPVIVAAASTLLAVALYGLNVLLRASRRTGRSDQE